MKLFGYEISKPNTAAETKKPTSVEIGDSGTSLFHGHIFEEYNTKLSGSTGIEVYDKMRKGDATVKSAILATSLPIRRAQWFVEPASEDPEDVKIAEFVEKALFEWQSITWNDLLRQALLSMPFGVMVFEKVFAVKHVDGRDWITWKKFAPRMPVSIHAWATGEGKDGIQQRKSDGTLVSIPIDRLLIFVNEKEGDNWWGTSILRAAYKHWRFKDGFYNIDAVAFERQGLGIPKAKMPAGFTDADKDRAVTILKNLRAHEQQYIVEPHDIEVEFMDMKGKQVRDPKESIQHHNREIVKAVLAQFLELGATDSGSRALSSDQTDLFLQSLEAVAGNIADGFNSYAIPQLVDLNFDNVTDYPHLSFKGISRVNVESLSNAYSTLTTAGGIMATDQDEQHFRELLGLPERDLDEEPREVDVKTESVDEEATEEIVDEVGMSEHLSEIKKKVYPTRSVIEAAVAHSLSHRSEPISWLKQLLARSEGLSTHKQFHSTLRGVLGATLAKEQRRRFQEGNDFTPENRDFRRPLTFAEEKVDFNAIRSQMDRLENGLTEDARALLLSESDRFMKELSRAANAGDYDAIKKASFRVKTGLAAILKKYFKDSYEFGKKNSSLEMGVESPSTPKAMNRQIDLAADTIADRYTAELASSAKLAANEALTKGETVAAALAVADRKLRESVEKKTIDTSAIAISGYINYGRATTFESNADDIYALQRSEILDSRTCNYCLSIDGRTVEKTDPFSHNTVFHSGCRGIWVEILQDEEEKPPVEGIPKSLRDRFGDAVNELVQPKTPFNKQDTDAKKEIKRRRDNRVKKQKK